MQLPCIQAGSAFATLLAFAWPLALRAAPEQAPAAREPAEEIRIVRASGPIEVDGSLDDPGWTGATRVDAFYEGFPGDSVPPKVKTVAWLAYDERYFFAAFEFSDPDPRSIRAPYGERAASP